LIRNVAKIFAFFASERNAKMKRNGRENFCSFRWKFPIKFFEIKESRPQFKKRMRHSHFFNRVFVIY